jgi:hypothetical protein
MSSGRKKRAVVAIAFLVLITRTASAVELDECKQQRAQYPKDWKNVSAEKTLFDCSSHYTGALRVKLGATDSEGRTLMSLVPLKQSAAGSLEEIAKTIYRIWLDKEQALRLMEGKYFATIVRKETSCWIRGDLRKDSLFFMDNADSPADGLRPGAGSFYNKAPRFSVFQGNAYTCEATK